MYTKLLVVQFVVDLTSEEKTKQSLLFFYKKLNNIMQIMFCISFIDKVL